MRKRILKFAFILVLFAFACSNLKDAPLEPRNAFAYFYPNKNNTFCSMSALDSDGGIISIGFRSVNATDLSAPKMFLLKTDARGRRIWDQDTYPDSLYGRSIKPVADGYLVTADRIKISTDENNVTSTAYLLNFFKMDLQGNVLFRYQTNMNPSANILSHAVNVDEQGNVVILASRITGLNNRLAMILRFSPSANGYRLISVQDEFDLQNRNYENGKSVQTTSTGSIIWATSITNPLTGRSYAAFPNIVPGNGPGGAFVGNQNIGETDDTFQRVAVDLQKNNFGFGAIGTCYQLSSGNVATASNFFFARLASTGTLVQGGALYYDGGVKIDDNNINTVNDAGITLTPASDGGFLLVGYMDTEPALNRGNGGKDVLLVKVDPIGSVQWSKTYGGIGDEVASSTFQTSDGGYIITGTSTIQGFASMFLIKTNSSGELSN